ncbi:prion-like-(Q/N-rich) domain-bearing protein 25 [Sitophilus oryzae]|uniref:Prion-like-(Q/N-rich) domain-bearing protein 25 n=1 Tax=Sitophilus oryzae TaxID=7048 RepID=A0A6J2X853_SITOR|nr:prion-like-(Q/N-rich) domain-bearing protein 25 [Sitophilus oryzae]
MHFLIIVFGIYFIGLGESINQTYSSDDDCAKDKSMCIDNIRQCDKLSNYSIVEEKCLKYATEYSFTCFEDWQCDKFLGNNAQCKNNKCLCSEGYRWYQGECKKILNKGDTCTDTDLCLDGNDPLALICHEGLCQCNTEYYDRGLDCRVKYEYSQECAINADCVSTDVVSISKQIYCGLGKCVSGNSVRTTATTNISLFNENRNKTSDTTCEKGVLSNLTKEECDECLNTLYFLNSTCICKQGFFLQDGQCIAELGMPDSNTHYSEDKDCPIKSGKLKDGICYCKNYWFQHYTNRECTKTTLQYTYNCMDNEWCKAMGPYAYCNSANQQCECISQARLNETSFLCQLQPDANITGLCLEDTECSLYEQCLDETCQCNDGYFKSNEDSSCLPKINSSCEIYDCSHIKNAKCSTDETCQCENDSYATDGEQCLEKATQLNQECLIEAQCENIKHAACLESSDNKSYCQCEDEYSDKNDTCYFVRSYGSQCSSKFDCTIILGDSFVCRNNLCQCPVLYTLKDNICVSNTSSKVVLSIWISALYIILIFL